MATTKGLKCVVLCVLILGLVLGQVQVEGKSCCPSTSARNCYNVCRLTGTSRPRCASLCGCKIVDGTCPDGYSKLQFLLESGEPDVTEYCTIGCMTSVCDNMDNGNYNIHHLFLFLSILQKNHLCLIHTYITSTILAPVIRGQESKMDMELCNSECVRFCNKGVTLSSKA
uniref:Uncharacterized protein n=1 Tax=Avena sativa TaxID=4498 RepID=A0ACD6APU6_AVESA